ncbi:MAG: glycosyltransferase [Cyanobium sp.]
MSRISLSMIVRDEAAQLRQCLESVAGFVDEMVVLDTGSRDDSAAIASACGARVHHMSWPGDFAPARNRALELTLADWVLVLDADERLLPQAKEPLRALIEQPDLLVINLLRAEEGAVQSPYSSVSRLFRRHPAIRWSRPYHAMVDDSVMTLLEREPHWRVRQWPEPALSHGGYRPELLAGSGKAARLRQAMEAELRAHPGDAYASAKLGGLELAEGRPGRAITLLEQGLAACPAQAHPERYELLLHLAMAHGDTDPPRARRLYREALALPLDPRLTLAARLNLAAVELRLGDLAAAAHHSQQATAAAPEVALCWYNAGLIHRQRGELPAAIAAYRRAIALAPQHAETHQNLAVALLLSGEIDGARQGFRRAIALLEAQNRPDAAAQLRRHAGAMVHLDYP